MYEQELSPAPAMGMVSNLQHCSVHDGPGIRTTVFLKGCNMRCQWCHNPETISFEREMLFYPEKCIGCGMCDEGCFAVAKVPVSYTHLDVFKRQVCDSSKLANEGMYTVAEFNRFSCMITDSGITPEQKKKYSEKMELIIA